MQKLAAISLSILFLLLGQGVDVWGQSTDAWNRSDFSPPDESTMASELRRLPSVSKLPQNAKAGINSALFVTVADDSSAEIFSNENTDAIELVGCDCGDIVGGNSRSGVLDKIVSAWENLDINGHIRARHETDFDRINRPTRNRQRLRARLGFTHTWNEEIKAGLRWTTGDRKIVLETDDRRGSPLSYQDAGDVFDKFEFNLDRIFITYSPDWLPDSFVTFGKFAPTWKLNPIFSSPVGDLVWDEAAQPEGVAFGHTRQDFLGLDQFYATLGESAVLELSNQDEASLFVIQVGGEKQLADRWALASSLTWYNWSNLNPDGNTRISTENNAGNSVTQVGIDTTQIGVTSPGGVPIIDGSPLFVFDSGFSIVNPMFVMTYDDREDSSGIEPLQFVYEAFYNDESFDAQRGFGYSIGAQYGPAVTRPGRKQFDWKAYYSWSEVGQESVFTPVAQDDFQLATNFRGHWLGLDIYPWDNVELRFWLLSSKPIDPITVGGVTSDETQWRCRADLTAYF